MGGVVRLVLLPDAKEARSSTARAEFKVFRPFGFLVRSLSFGPTVALAALILAVRRIELASFRVAEHVTSRFRDFEREATRL